MHFFISPHLMRITLAWLIFYYIFNLMFHSEMSPKRKIFTYFSLFIISILFNLFIPDLFIILIAITIYFSIWHQQSVNYYLINIILLNISIKFYTLIISSPFLIFLFPNTSDNYSYIDNLGICLTEFILSLAFVYFYNYFKLNDFFATRKTAMTSIIIGYIYAIFYIALVLVQYLETYAPLITGIIIFTLFQSLFVIFIFAKSRRRKRKVYQDKFSEEQVKSLKIYTDQLEHDQLKLRHFKHDYKNLLFSLKTVASEKNYSAMNQALSDLENYSDDYLQNLSMDLYQDLNNVTNPYLKSLFIDKINTINQKGIKCYFNCYDSLSEVPINVFDLIKLLDQAIDNAIKLTEVQDQGQIQLVITKEGQLLAFLINSSVSNFSMLSHEPDYSKAWNIKELKRKYSNIFIQHSKNDKWLRLHITLVNH